MSKELANLLTNESKLVFPNGEVIEGGEKVMSAILGMCEAYTSEYVRKLGQGIALGVVGGIVVGVVINIVKDKKSKKI